MLDSVTFAHANPLLPYGCHRIYVSGCSMRLPCSGAKTQAQPGDPGTQNGRCLGMKGRRHTTSGIGPMALA